MNIELYNGFYISSNLTLGSSDPSRVTPEMLNNALNIYSFFHQLSWSDQAIAAIMGNMQVESTLNPGITQTRRVNLPENLDVLYYKSGLGLVQWTTTGADRDTGKDQKLVRYALRNNYNWYDGWAQCYRLKGEHDSDATYHFFYKVKVNGQFYTFQNFVTSTAPVADLTKAWLYGYERATLDADSNRRIADAEYWFDWIQTMPEPVEPGYPLPADPDKPLPPQPLPPDTPGDLPIWLLAVLARKHTRQINEIIRRYMHD